MAGKFQKTAAQGLQSGGAAVIIAPAAVHAHEKVTLSCDSIAAEEVKKMKEGIHPKYQKATVTCVCGNTFQTGSTKKELRVEICSKCHPFFTGKQKLVDTGGRVDRFKKRYGL